jgi:hypothetical protein
MRPICRFTGPGSSLLLRETNNAPNDGRWLRSVELEARGVEGFGLYDLSILRDLTPLPPRSQGARSRGRRRLRR